MIKQLLTTAAGISLIALLTGDVTAQTTAVNPEKSEETFETIMRHLDKGGDLLVVANVEGWLENMLSIIPQLAKLDISADPSAAQTISTLQKLPVFMKKNGFYAVTGVGMSVVPREDGLNDYKSFICRDEAAIGLPLWRGLVGTAPKELTSLDYIPANSVLTRVCISEPAQLWKMVKAGIKELGGEEAEAGFDMGIQMFSAQVGVSIDELIASLGKEGFFSLQLSGTKNLDIPLTPGQEPITIPEPSLLIGLSVKNNMLASLITNQLQKTGMPIEKTTVAGTSIQSINLPVPLPIPLKLSFTTDSGMLLLASSDELLKTALTAKKTKNGLVATEKFKKAFDDLPLKNNGLFYMSPRFNEVVMDVQTKAMANNPGIDTDEFMPLINNMYGMNKEQSAAIVIRNLKSGISVKGTSSSGGREIAASVMIAPMGMMAAIAIPSFVKARSTSQKNACINNLRQLDSAKEQWALAEKKMTGDIPDEAGVLEYVKGGMPTCPAGGTYTLNAISANPTCSMNHDGHRLR